MKKTKILKQVLDYAHSSKGEQLFFCPFCKHHKPKLSVNIEKNVFKCWVCDTRGRDNYYLIKRFGNFNQQQEWLKLTNQTDINDFEIMFSGSIQKDIVEQVIDLPDEYKSLANNTNLSQIPALNYLKKRGIDKKDVLKWRIGYCAGGEYDGRVIIPSFNENGNVNYFVARSCRDEFPRYKNPPVSRNIAFNELSIDWEEDVVIVEGVFDAIKAENAIPLLGSTLREDSALFQKLIEHSPTVYIALDADVEKKASSLIQKLLYYGIDIYKITVPKYKDIGDMTKEEFASYKNNSKPIDNTNFVEFSYSMF